MSKSEDNFSDSGPHYDKSKGGLSQEGTANSQRTLRTLSGHTNSNLEKHYGFQDNSAKPTLETSITQENSPRKSNNDINSQENQISSQSSSNQEPGLTTSQPQPPMPIKEQTSNENSPKRSLPQHELRDLTLSELLVRYEGNKEMLGLVLSAKSEEDRAKVERERRRIEELRLENKRMDLEFERFRHYRYYQHRPQYPVGPMTAHPVFQPYPYPHHHPQAQHRYPQGQHYNGQFSARDRMEVSPIGGPRSHTDVAISYRPEGPPRDHQRPPAAGSSHHPVRSYHHPDTPGGPSSNVASQSPFAFFKQPIGEVIHHPSQLHPKHPAGHRATSYSGNYRPHGGQHLAPSAKDQDLSKSPARYGSSSAASNPNLCKHVPPAVEGLSVNIGALNRGPEKQLEAGSVENFNGKRLQSDGPMSAPVRGPSFQKRKIRHEDVLEALRRKVRANTQAKALSAHPSNISSAMSPTSTVVGPGMPPYFRDSQMSPSTGNTITPATATASTETSSFISKSISAPESSNHKSSESIGNVKGGAEYRGTTASIPSTIREENTGSSIRVSSYMDDYDVSSSSSSSSSSSGSASPASPIFSQRYGQREFTYRKEAPTDESTTGHQKYQNSMLGKGNSVKLDGFQNRTTHHNNSGNSSGQAPRLPSLSNILSQQPSDVSPPQKRISAVRSTAQSGCYRPSPLPDKAAGYYSTSSPPASAAVQDVAVASRSGGGSSVINSINNTPNNNNNNATSNTGGTSTTAATKV
ncbi:hypothetical protein H4219_000955 [Mycoemilia scoparia]|uniref:Uncharacterized protein n=1 Tax=Mycoemilia scoparia TaxID=417184 RepID=A0A9W8A9Q4_9FUNG|nr:hypothetical protein H4219_000955 [Mycoemilia scoparia]